jgi:hypothetical protein
MIDLSIIIPIYIKPLEKIQRSVDSALDQNCNIELIIVYQWFSEESYDYLQDLCEKNKNVKLFFYEYPLSHHIARISHIKDCNGEYTAFLDSDDYVDKNYYVDCINELKQQNADATSGNLKLYWDDELQPLEKYKSNLKKEDFMFGDYWLRGIFKTDKIKNSISLFENYKYYLTHHDDFLEKIILFHCCDKVVLIKNDNTYYHFLSESTSTDNWFIFKNINSIILIYHLLKDFVSQNYSYFNNRFKEFIYRVTLMDKNLKSRYFNSLFNSYSFTTIPPVVFNNNFNFQYFRVSLYETIQCLPTHNAGENYKLLFLQFYTLYNYGGVFCTEDYYFNNLDELLQRELLIFEDNDMVRIDVIGACIKNPIIEKCFQYLVHEEHKDESLNYYKKKLKEIVPSSYFAKENFSQHFIPVVNL